MSARVLVVDDVPANVRLLEAKLGSEYFEVVTAGDGLKALEQAKREHPDIILLDVMMPGMDGFEVCRRLKADPATQHIPVIMVTALNDQSDRVQGLEAGADDFLTKPVDDVALFARVRSLVRLKLMFDELRLREATSDSIGLIECHNGEEPALDGVRILVLQEQGRDATRIGEALGGRYEIAGIADANEAMQRARAEDFALVIVDLDHGSADGLRFCSQLRAAEETRQVPILMLVDPMDKKRLLKGLELGVTDYVVKPIDRNELLARVRTQVRRKAYQDRLRSNYHRSVTMAVTDALTGMYNRRYVSTHLETLISRRGKERYDLAVLMIDIDYFKKINDENGHAAGDEVLREFANRIRRNVRGVDLAARYGGEEFLVVLPDTDRETAHLVAERLRRQISEAPFPIDGGAGQLTVTCSIGVAMLAEAEDPDALVKRADGALYSAKHGGRDQVVIAA